MLGDLVAETVSDVNPHWFVIVSGHGVFDSSLTHGSIQGISTDLFSPNPVIQVIGGERAPSKDEVVSRLQQCEKPFLAWYVSTKMSHPARPTVEWISDTPFGNWLTDRYGSQKGLWAKAAWIAADILNGAPPPISSDRDALWDLTVNTADKNEAVIRLCEQAAGGQD
jgi:hypothetical protein